MTFSAASKMDTEQETLYVGTGIFCISLCGTEDPKNVKQINARIHGIDMIYAPQFFKYHERGGSMADKWTHAWDVRIFLGHVCASCSTGGGETGRKFSFVAVHGSRQKHETKIRSKRFSCGSVSSSAAN